MNKFRIWIPILLILLISCKTTRQINKKPETIRVSYEVINTAVPDYSWLQAKGKITYKDKENQQEASLVLVIRHDSLIWGSINAVMGFEIFRFYITHDSLYMINRPAKKYYGFSLNEIMMKYGWKDADFKVFENLITGYCIFKTDEHYPAFKDEITGALYIHNQDMILDKKIYLENRKKPVTGYILTRLDNSQRISINYKDEISASGISIPAIVDLKYFSPEEFSLNLTFSSIRLIQHLNLNTTIPEGYEKGN
jgi:hypothetical protein